METSMGEISNPHLMTWEMQGAAGMQAINDLASEAEV